MCGRYSQLRSWSDWVRLYNITAGQMPLNLAPRYNIAPTQDVPVVRSTREGRGRELVLLRWGFSFMTRGRGARLITGEGTRPSVRLPAPHE